LFSERASTKHQVLKNSLNGRITIDFDAVALKILENFEFYENGRLKNYTRQIPVIHGKNEIHKSHFSDELYSVASPRVKTKTIILDFSSR
jgi:hypothetical protein